MQRPLDPKSQVTLIQTFIRELGAEPKQTALYELVAKLNGAPNWNALTARKARGGASVQAEAEPMALDKDAGAAPGTSQPTMTAFVRQASLDWPALFLRVNMFEESALTLLNNGASGPDALGTLNSAQVAELVKSAVVVEADIGYPAESSQRGLQLTEPAEFQAWLVKEWKLSFDAALYVTAHQASYTQTMFCDLTLRVPPALARQIKSFFEVLRSVGSDSRLPSHYAAPAPRAARDLPTRALPTRSLSERSSVVPDSTYQSITLRSSLKVSGSLRLVGRSVLFGEVEKELTADQVHRVVECGVMHAAIFPQMLLDDANRVLNAFEKLVSFRVMHGFSVAFFAPDSGSTDFFEMQLALPAAMVDGLFAELKVRRNTRSAEQTFLNKQG